MEPHRLVRKASQFLSDFALARLRGFEFGLNACAFQNTGGEGIEEGTNPALQVLLFALETIVPVISTVLAVMVTESTLVLNIHICKTVPSGMTV